ncbi:pentapeptide repeat-containing protein [Streptomyces sp. TLI_146]|uniref:pentapeptide repeat-containing protein n=1 Tax=Streptomyces sp. TLI_146 TaxID=1938858 RepID=UPI000C7007DF|nr:pentapeptide repeat-containing protein [Streptomyces sp. TLI_146]PKV82853.1 pentapeptide repeat protein [Streptomyces sp. TLI_146]
MTEREREHHAAALRGLLYLACPDASGTAISETADAIAQHTQETPHTPVPEAWHLGPAYRITGPLNLKGADLSDADLSGAVLRRADLRDTNMRGANMHHADLEDALLDGADLLDADLSGAVLRHALMNRADLSGADLSGADLDSAVLVGATLHRADLRGAILETVMHMTLPLGATWDSHTRWPHGLATRAAEESDEVAPGVYRVRDEGILNRANPVRV